MICPACGKPYYRNDGATVTLASTVWPYCQCVHGFFPTTITTNTTALTIHATAGSSGGTGWGEITPGYNTVPDVFQEAFSDGELDV